MPNTLRLFFQFIFHIVVAAICFAALALVAVGAWYFTEWLKHIGAPVEITSICDYLHMGLFYLDVGSFCIFVLAEALRFVKEILK